MFESKTRDNSSLLVKLMLRKSLLGLKAVEQKCALDLFAGNGEIASRVYQDFPELHLVENDSAKFARLKRKFGDEAGIKLWNLDNREFLARKLKTIPELSVVDFDAYGSPNRQIQLFFENRRLKKQLLIFATDGFTLARLRGREFSPMLYCAGPDSESGAGYDPVLSRNFELLIRAFWEEMSKLHQFRIPLFKILWKKRRQVAYYGLWIEPK